MGSTFIPDQNSTAVLIRSGLDASASSTVSTSMDSTSS